MIYSALSEEFAQGLHALSLKTKTEAEIKSTSTQVWSTYNRYACLLFGGPCYLFQTHKDF